MGDLDELLEVADNTATTLRDIGTFFLGLADQIEADRTQYVLNHNHIDDFLTDLQDVVV